MNKKNRSFSILLTGQSLADIGDILYIVSAISIIYRLTNSAISTALVPFIITSSMLISSLLTPIFTTKCPLNRLLTISQGFKTAVLVGLASYVEWVGAKPIVVYIYVMIAIIALLDGCANPIRQSLLPHYVEEKDLLRANSIAESVIQSIQVGSWFVGSSLLILFTPSQLLWVVVFLFFLATVLLNLLPDVSWKQRQQTKKRQLVVEGWQTILQSPVLKIAARMDLLESIAGAAWVAAILLVFVEEALQVSSQWWGYLNGIFFIGMIIGSMICLKWTSVVDRKKAVFICGGALLSAIFTLFFAFSPTALLALLCSFMIGICGQLKNIPQQTIVQISVTKEKLPTVYTSLNVIVTGVFGISSFILGILSEWYGVRMVFVVSSMMLLVVSIIAYKNKKFFT
ncbi:MFS transporter [Lysinibacillus irui]|uniref:MFS transporter n=1 Tax=Lysinibacillus irui TaxID=2998077 RepID=UPI0038872FE6